MPLVSTFDILCEEREEKARIDFAIEFCERFVGDLPKKTKTAISNLDLEALLELQALAAESKSVDELKQWVENQSDISQKI